MFPDLSSKHGIGSVSTDGDITPFVSFPPPIPQTGTTCDTDLPSDFPIPNSNLVEAAPLAADMSQTRRFFL